MTPWQLIEQLYDSEINAGLETDWDGGITAWIGRAPRLSERTFPRREFGEVADWLDLEARCIFPESKYARTVPAANP
jgi:hypothetical protein